MSTINNGTRPPHVAGSVDTSDNSNLSKIAQKEGVFTGKSDDANNDDDDTGKAGKAGGKAAAHVKPAGLGSGGQSTRVGSSAASQPSLLPGDDGAQEPIDQQLAVDTNTLASDPQGTSAAVTKATGQLTTDLAQTGTTQATLETDLKNLSTALQSAGITTPTLASVVGDLADPTGTGVGVKANSPLAAAAKAQNIDLSKDSVDPRTAQTALTQALAASPVSQAAVDLATAHVVRTNALAGMDAGSTIATVGQGLGTDNASGLAALYAAAAKAGVDLTGKSDDAAAKAKNDAVTQKMNKSDQQTIQQKNNNVGGSGRGNANNPSAAGYGTGTPGNTTQYGAIAKQGNGTTSYGYNTSGDEAIAPNPDNPVDFQTQYGLSGGFSSVSLDDLLAQLPQLTSAYPDIKNILTTAANSVSPPLPPQLLLSTLGVETSYATNSNQDGPFQFSDNGAWAKYGHNGDKTDMLTSATAAAGYYHDLLAANGNNLYDAMRDYNGDVTQGASTSYQADQQRIFNGNANLE